MADDTLVSTALEKYAATLADMSPEDRDRRLNIMHGFAKFVDRCHDRMVEEIYDRVTMKYKKRGFYTERLNAFADSAGGARATKVFTGNVIRAFFIANGCRIPPDKPSWM
jgi:hypothetical protein